MRCRLFGCLMLCLALSAWSLGHGGARADTPLDYMVQEVCDNGSGGHTTADPVTCPATARKLNIREALPYHKWDSVSAQISDSYPVADSAGTFRAVQMEFFDNPSAFIQPLFDAGDPHTGRSGYDMIMADASSNCALIYSIPDGPSGQGVYQDALAPGRANAHFPAGNYTFGAFLWSPTGATITGTMTLFQLNSALGIISQTNVPVTLTGTRTFFQGAFTVTGTSTARFRFQIYPATVGPNYEMTESWIAPAL